MEKVPNARHDYQKGEWEAIVCIIVFGYSEVKYFPITLSCAFVATVFFGEESLAPDFLIESFKLYVSQDEKELIAKISVMSPIVINMPTRELLAGETKNSFV